MDRSPGLALVVNGTPRQLRGISLHCTSDATLPVWTADVDGSLGCGGTLEAAILLAARAADLGLQQDMEAKQ